MTSIRPITVGCCVLALGAVGLLSVSDVAADNHAKAKSFDFQDPKGVNAFLFMMDSETEPIVGMGRNVRGKVSYDGKQLVGSIQIDAKDLDTSNDRMTKVMQGEPWLNIAEHKTISVTFGKVMSVTPEKNGSRTLMQEATITVLGVPLQTRISVNATHIPDGAKKRGGAKSGDLLVLRSTFEFDRKDFGIKPDMDFVKVGQKIQIIANIAGYEK
jgi:polyisoprenoid-binding protein YceI